MLQSCHINNLEYTSWDKFKVNADKSVEEVIHDFQSTYGRKIKSFLFQNVVFYNSDG